MNKKLIFSGITIISLIISTSVFSQSQNVTLESKWIKRAYGNNVFVDGNYAYYSSLNIMSIIDISDTNRLTGVGQYVLPNTISWIVVKNNYAYITALDSGLRIVNVSNPEISEEEGVYKGNNITFNKVEISGNYAYIASIDSGLRVIDISNHSQPNEVGVLNTGFFALDMAVSGNYAYVAANDSLIIVDISNPSTPFIATTITSFSGLGKVFINGNYAYLLENSYLKIFDISNPLLPSQLSSSNGYGFFSETSFFVSDSLLITDAGAGLECDIWNISNPLSPVVIGTYYTDGFSGDIGNQIYVYGNRLYIPTRNKGMDIVNILNPSSPQLKFSYIDDGFYSEVKRYGNLLFSAHASMGDGIMDIYDINDIYHPHFINTYRNFYSFGAPNFEISGNYLFFTNGSHALEVLDISNPLQILPIGYYDVSKANVYSVGIDVSSNYAYVCMQNSGLYVIDISNPSNPFKASSLILSNGFNAMQVSVSGNYAYVMDNDRTLHAIDISNPLQPTELSSLQIVSQAYNALNGDKIYISNNRAFISLYTSGVAIVDINNPDSLFLINLYSNVVNAQETYVVNDFAYIADFNSGLQVVNVSNPYLPVQSGYYYDVFSYSRSVYADTSNVYLGNDYGIYILKNDLDNNIEEALSSLNSFNIYPNPTHNQLTVITSREYQSLSIYNLQGQQIKFIKTKGQQYTINIEDLSAGFYFLKVTTDKESNVTKFVKE